MEQPEQNVVARPSDCPSRRRCRTRRRRTRPSRDAPGAAVFEAKNVSIYYGAFRAVTDVR